jgi:hypothetical protein
MKEDSLWLDGDPLDDVQPIELTRNYRKSDGYIGCPLSWLELVVPVVHGKGELVVALYLYRLRIVQQSRTVALPNTQLLARFGVNRFTKYRALQHLAEAGIISVKQRNKEAPRVTFRRLKSAARR